MSNHYAVHRKHNIEYQLNQNIKKNKFSEKRSPHEKTETQGESHMMMKTEIGVISLQNKDFQQPPETRTDILNMFSLRASRLC